MYLTVVPTATWLLPISGCTYPSCGDAPADGLALGVGCQIVEQAYAGWVAAENTPAPTIATTATIPAATIHRR